MSNFTNLLEALFDTAGKDGREPGYWVFDPDIAEEYRDCSRYAENAREELRRTLSGGAVSVFERFMDNSEEQRGLEKRIMFNRGLAAGIYLASLGR